MEIKFYFSLNTEINNEDLNSYLWEKGLDEQKINNLLKDNNNYRKTNNIYNYIKNGNLQIFIQNNKLIFDIKIDYNKEENGHLLGLDLNILEDFCNNQISNGIFEDFTNEYVQNYISNIDFNEDEDCDYESDKNLYKKVINCDKYYFDYQI